MNPFDLLKNMDKIKAQMGQMQEKMGSITVSGSAGGDLVQVRMNGQFQILEVKLAPECVDPRDIPMLQDLILSAANDAVNKIREKLKDEMGAMGALGQGFPGMG